MKYTEIMQSFHILKGIEKRFEIYMRGGKICKIPPYFNYSSVGD